MYLLREIWAILSALSTVLVYFLLFLSFAFAIPYLVLHAACLLISYYVVMKRVYGLRFPLFESLTENIFLVMEWAEYYEIWMDDYYRRGIR
jgi:hypothetical protein